MKENKSVIEAKAQEERKGEVITIADHAELGRKLFNTLLDNVQSEYTELAQVKYAEELKKHQEDIIGEPSDNIEDQEE